MSLKLYARKNGVWHVRGTVQGERFDHSARTRDRSEAEAIRAKWEADAFKRAVYGERAVASFADAVSAYIRAGGDPTHLDPLLDAFGHMKLSDVKQSVVDAEAAKRAVKASTLIRQIYTPVCAVLNLAADQGLCEPPRIRKPKVKEARVDYLTPAQAEEWIKILPPHLERLFIFYLATGCRASEALDLEWRDVSPDAQRVVFWLTKGGYARGADLQSRARGALPDRTDGKVFLNSRGDAWHGYDAINLMFRRHRERNPKLAPVHCHQLRHTWATWAYAVTKDLTFVMAQGGWRSLALLGRYTHAASPDLASAVLDHGWEIVGTPKKPPRRTKPK